MTFVRDGYLFWLEIKQKAGWLVDTIGICAHSRACESLRTTPTYLKFQRSNVAIEGAIAAKINTVTCCSL